jgi:hypothetical protein
LNKETKKEESYKRNTHKKFEFEYQAQACGKLPARKAHTQRPPSAATFGKGLEAFTTKNGKKGVKLPTEGRTRLLPGKKNEESSWEEPHKETFPPNASRHTDKGSTREQQKNKIRSPRTLHQRGDKGTRVDQEFNRQKFAAENFRNSKEPAEELPERSSCTRPSTNMGARSKGNTHNNSPAKNTATAQDVEQHGMDDLGPDGQDAREESARPAKRQTSTSTTRAAGNGDVTMPSEEEGSSWEDEDLRRSYTTPET